MSMSPHTRAYCLIALLGSLLTANACSCADEAPPAQTPNAAVAAGDTGADAPIEDVDLVADAAEMEDVAQEDMGGPMDVAQDVMALEDVLEDAAEDVAEDVVADPPACRLAATRPEGDRVVLIGHPFAAEIGVRGTEVRTMTLTAAGELLDNGVRVDIGIEPQRMVFTPSGEVAVVIDERDKAVSLRVRAVDDVSIISRVDLPAAGFGDLVAAPDGRTVYALGVNSTPDGGINTLTLGCEDEDLGVLTVVSEAFTPYRNAQSMGLMPGGERALLVGGQALYEPMDQLDIRLVEPRDGAPFEEIAAFDVYTDFLTLGKIGLSADGTQALIPNHALFSEDASQLRVLKIEGDVVTEVGRFTDLPDIAEAHYAPDQQTVLTTQVEPGRVKVFTREGDTLESTELEFRVGLVEQMAWVRSGALSGRVLLSGIDPTDGSHVRMLHVTGKGVVEDLGAVFFEEGSIHIPDAIAVAP